MTLYILKSVLCSALLIGAYYLFLEREKTHRFKRFYLIASLFLSFIIPLITIEISQQEIVNKISEITEYLPMDAPLITELSKSEIDLTGNTADHPEAIASNVNWATILLLVYSLVAMVLLFRLGYNFLSILSDVNDKSLKSYLGATFVFHKKYVIPYSFLNYVFIQEDDYHNRQILLHELTHVRQKHTLDILLIEFIHCVMWFNPVMFLYKKAIRLNHEFLADEVVVKNFPTAGYQQILFQKAQIPNAVTLTSNLNYSGTKKRFIMMTTMKNQTRAMVKAICSFLVICCAVVTFSEKIYAQVMDTTKTKTNTILRDSVTSKYDTLEFDIIINGLKKTGVTKNGKPHTLYNLTSLTNDDKQKLIALYARMTEKQKADPDRSLIIYFCHPPKPPIKQSPTSDQLKTWADAAIYGVWIDGKRVANEKLSTFSPKSFSFFLVSRLKKNAYTPGKHTQQVDLFTNAYYDKSYSAKSN